MIVRDANRPDTEQKAPPRRSPIQLDLLRLRSATRAYVAILEGVLPAVEAMGEQAGLLHDCIGLTLDRDAREMSAVRSIADELAVLLGEAPDWDHPAS